jgi:hypothetical protein
MIDRAGANGIIGSTTSCIRPRRYSLLFVAGTIVIGAVLTKAAFRHGEDPPIVNLLDPLRILTVHASMPVNSLQS